MVYLVFGLVYLIFGICSVWNSSFNDHHHSATRCWSRPWLWLRCIWGSRECCFAIWAQLLLPPCLLFICPVNLALVCSKVVQWRCKTLHLLPNSEEWHPRASLQAPPSERSRPYSSRCNRAAAGQSAQLYEASHCCYWVCPTSKSASLLLVKSCQERDISGRVTRTSKPHRRNLSS